MKIVKIIVLSALGVFIFGGYMRAVLRYLMDEGFWPGLAGILVCFGIMLVPIATKIRARLKARTETAAQIATTPRRRRLTKVSGAKVARLLAAYPGPVKLKATRTRWWVLMVLGVVSTAPFIFIGVKIVLSLPADNLLAAIVLAVSVFGTCGCGLLTVLSARALLRGGLQIDRNGFQVTLLTRNPYLWTEVIDFRPCRDWPVSGVQFNAVRPRLLDAGWIHSSPPSSNDAVGDNFGLEAEELADLMESWQSAALDDQGNEQPLAPAVSG
ncbi:hypothetical protein JQ596_28805 [Bradyrhizobium manausense]|uniref:hypothetical protein n=1 Tax=Bradyrhizobium TaxID=374 RepID=UPI001BABFEC6|nr:MULTISPECIES: hypothetical protein [Bradyrhizobium]MBR0829542.1 hypothetical protein [Bradyrhizobium manausense]UVO25912.1 hypothetical protein KUF59_25445 [Bradyrhizobium arachidis]